LPMPSKIQFFPHRNEEAGEDSGWFKSNRKKNKKKFQTLTLRIGFETHLPHHR
jgi:hypothetical protein